MVTEKIYKGYLIQWNKSQGMYMCYEPNIQGAPTIKSSFMFTIDGCENTIDALVPKRNFRWIPESWTKVENKGSGKPIMTLHYSKNLKIEIMPSATSVPSVPKAFRARVSNGKVTSITNIHFSIYVKLDTILSTDFSDKLDDFYRKNYKAQFTKKQLKNIGDKALVELSRRTMEEDMWFAFEFEDALLDVHYLEETGKVYVYEVDKETQSRVSENEVVIRVVE